jgi:hypothetical protein
VLSKEVAIQVLELLTYLVLFVISAIEVEVLIMGKVRAHITTFLVIISGQLQDFSWSLIDVECRQHQQCCSNAGESRSERLQYLPNRYTCKIELNHVVETRRRDTVGEGTIWIGNIS